MYIFVEITVITDMKTLIAKVAAAVLVPFLSSAVAMAQTPRIAIANYSAGQTRIYNENGRLFTVDGELVSLGSDGENIWTLTRFNGNQAYSRYYTVYKNGKVAKIYEDEDSPSAYYSMAMRVKDGHVVIAGSRIWPFNKRGFESSLFGEVDFKKVFETSPERKSLKRERFRGFSTVKGTKLVLPEYDVDGTGSESVVFGVKDVDYYKGKIYATGWGEREYTYTLGYKYYLVRRCPRVWKNGKETVSQYENQTGAAYSINVVKAGGSTHILTSGHHRGRGCGWDGSKKLYQAQYELSVDAEAILVKGSNISRCFVSGNELWYACTSGDSVEPELVMGYDQNKCFVVDVVADQDNMDYYVLLRPGSKDRLEVWKIHCRGTSLNSPKKLFSLDVEDSYLNSRITLM